MNFEPSTVPGARPGGSGYAATVAVAVGAALMALLAGCTPSTDYVGSAEQGLYFEIPNTWHTFNNATLTRLQLINAQEVSTAQAEEESYPVYISLSSSTSHFTTGDQAGSHPWALAEVRSLGASDQQTISLQGLQDQLWPVSAAVGSENQLFPTRLVSKGALRGTIIGYQINTPTGSLAFEQVAVINSATTKIWMLSDGCSPACFKKNRAVLDHIIRTFTVTGQKG